MEGGKHKGLNKSLRKGKKDKDDDPAGNINTDENGKEEKRTSRSGGEVTILTAMREVLKDMTMEMRKLRSDIAKQLSDYQNNFQVDIKKQLSQLKADITQ